MGFIILIQLCIRLVTECAISRVTSPLGMHVLYIAIGTLRTIMTSVRLFLLFNLLVLCHSKFSLMLSTDINITETTYSSQFYYEFGNEKVCNSCQIFTFH